MGPDSVYTCSPVSARSPTCHHDQSAPPPLQPVGAIPSIATKDTEIGGSVSTAPCTRFAGTGMDVSVAASDIPPGSSLPLSMAPVPNGPACRANKTNAVFRFNLVSISCGGVGVYSWANQSETGSFLTAVWRRRQCPCLQPGCARESNGNASSIVEIDQHGRGCCISNLVR